MLSCEYRAAIVTMIFAVIFSAQAQILGDCQRRSVVVNPRKDGKLVAGLQSSSFRGSLPGEPVKILAARPNTRPPRVVVLLDLSGSMNRSNHKLDTAQFLAEDIIAASLTPRVALVLFSDRPLDVVGFDHAAKAIQQKLANLGDGQGSTALFSSLMYSAGLFQSPESGDTIYAITDGGDSGSGLREKDVEQKFLSQGIRLFSFVVSSSRPPLITEMERQHGYSDLRRLAEVSGGSILNAEYDPYEHKSGELEASLKRGYDKMKSFYTLDMELPVKLYKDEQWRLDIVDGHGKRRNDIETMHPAYFVSCHQSSADDGR
jgi:hypothetical protein